jgi:YidC/Oxa1 family membrane protein insertase
MAACSALLLALTVTAFAAPPAATTPAGAPVVPVVASPKAATPAATDTPPVAPAAAPAATPTTAPAVPAKPIAPVKLAPASPLPIPVGVDPFSIPILPNAPMPKFVKDVAPPHAFDVAIKMFNDGRYTDAINELSKVQASASYRNSPYIPASLYRIAQIHRDYLHEDATAMQQYNTLTAQYGAVIYPGSANAVEERLALAKKIDVENSSTPLYKLISYCVMLTGSKSYSYWIGLLIIAVLVRLVLTPLTIKQYKSMREMQRLQPLLKEIQTKYEKDPQLKGQKMMELYKEHNVSPMAGCVPMLLQMPVYYYMYQAIVQYQYHFSYGTFLWVNDTTAAWAHKIYPGIIGRNLMEQDMILLLIYSASMYVTQRMMPATDPSQAETQKTTALIMSVFFFVMFIQWHFPSAFVLYWLFSNILGTVTQLYYMKQGDHAPLGVTPVLAGDGDTAVSGRNGNSKSLTNGTAPRKNPTAKPAGTARGIIAPKTHPKKKRR